VIGSRQPKPARMSLAQFSRNLISSESHNRPDYASSTANGVGLERIGQKRFAADVVAAMSIPALQPHGVAVGNPG
jgi:hypothetical protein